MARKKKQIQMESYQQKFAVINFDPPKTLKQLRSLMGSMHHVQKIILILSKLSASLRPILSHKKLIKSKLDWNEEHTKLFQQLKNAIKQIKENKHFDTNRPTGIRCDATKEGLGACLEQKYDNGWHPIAYASRFLNTNKQKYNKNELDLLSFVWSLEHFKYYLYGSRFPLQTDHQALLSALKDNRGNKTYQSRLTKWVDRQLSFYVSVEQIAAKKWDLHTTSVDIPHQQQYQYQKKTKILSLIQMPLLNLC